MSGHKDAVAITAVDLQPSDVPPVDFIVRIRECQPVIGVFHIEFG